MLRPLAPIRNRLAANLAELKIGKHSNEHARLMALHYEAQLADLLAIAVKRDLAEAFPATA